MGWSHMEWDGVYVPNTFNLHNQLGNQFVGLTQAKIRLREVPTLATMTLRVSQRDGGLDGRGEGIPVAPDRSTGDVPGHRPRDGRPRFKNTQTIIDIYIDFGLLAAWGKNNKFDQQTDRCFEHQSAKKSEKCVEVNIGSMNKTITLDGDARTTHE